MLEDIARAYGRASAREYAVLFGEEPKQFSCGAAEVDAWGRDFEKLVAVDGAWLDHAALLRDIWRERFYGKSMWKGSGGEPIYPT